MKRAEPSKTAEAMALYRYSEMFFPPDLRICEDPYAVKFLGPEITKMFSLPPEQLQALAEHQERRLPGVRDYIMVRVRYIDDLARRCAREGHEQLVILGAGYDTRAYRIEELKGVKIFEIDHPDTQALKKEKAREIFGSLPDHVTFVPVDFEAQKLGARLIESGFDRSLKTLFIMEGLLMYLPPAAVDETLAYISHNSAKGSAIVFDYLPQRMIDGTCESEVEKNFGADLAALGEPLQWGLKPGMATRFLKARGFSEVTDLTAGDLKKRYFTGKNEGRQICGFFSIAYAVV